MYLDGRKEEALRRWFPQSDSPANLRYAMYDWDTLAAALTQAGCVDIRRRAYQEGDLPDVALLDNRPEESLFIEARKPRSQ